MTGFALGEVALGSLPNIPKALQALGAAKTYCRDTIAATAHLSAKAASVAFDTSSATFNLALRGILHAQVTGQLFGETGIVAIVANSFAKIVSSFSPPHMASSIGAHSFFKMSGFPMPSGTTKLPTTRTISIVSGSTGSFTLTRFFTAFSNSIGKSLNSANFIAGLIGTTSSNSLTALSKLPVVTTKLFVDTISQVSSSVAAIGNTVLSSKAAAKAFARTTKSVATLLFVNTLSVSSAKARETLSDIVMTTVGSAQSLANASAVGRVTIAATRSFAAVSGFPMVSGAISFIGRSASFARGRATVVNEKLLIAVSTAVITVRGSVKVATGLMVNSPAITKAITLPSGVLGLFAHTASGVKDTANTVLVKAFHATSSITKTAGAVAANFSAAMVVQALSVAKTANRNVVGKVNLSQATSAITASINRLMGAVNLLTRTRSSGQGFANRFLQTLLASSSAFIRSSASITSLKLQMAARSLAAIFVEFGNHPPETIGRPVIGSGGADPVSGEVNNDEIEEP